MVFQIIIYLSVLVLVHEVKSVEFDNVKSFDLTGKAIEMSKHCATQKCIIKCCPAEHFIIKRIHRECIHKKELNNTKLKDFSEIYVYKTDNDSSLIRTNESIASAFHFVQTDTFSDLETLSRLAGIPHILQDGSLKITYENETSESVHIDNRIFCIDYLYTNRNNRLMFVKLLRGLESKDAKSKNLFVVIGLSVSSFFSALVLVVYSLLPKLRTLPGLIMMGYLSTFIVTCIIKAVQLIGLSEGYISEKHCRHLYPAMYYFTWATFFWLNCMSIEVWRLTAKPMQYSSGAHSHGQLTSRQQVKLRRYCVYALGTPAVLIGIIVALDRNGLIKDELFQPPFNSCLIETAPSVWIYMHLPIAIITISNAILFCIAAYTIWQIRGQVDNKKDSTNTKSESRFCTCLKIYVVTGVTWILELIPNDIPFALYIVVNFYNVCVGIIIFYIFVCKRAIIYALCKRLNINNSFVESLQSTRYVSETSNSTRLATMSEKRHLNENSTSDESTSKF